MSVAVRAASPVGCVGRFGAAGVHARRQVVVDGDLGEEVAELSTFLGCEHPAEVVFVIGGRRGEAGHGVAACAGEHDQALSPVVWMGVAADQPGILELVEHHDEALGRTPRAPANSAWLGPPLPAIKRSTPDCAPVSPSGAIRSANNRPPSAPTWASRKATPLGCVVGSVASTTSAAIGLLVALVAGVVALTAIRRS